MDGLVFRSLLSPDFFDSLLTKGKSMDKRERFASSDPIPSPPLRLHESPYLLNGEVSLLKTESNTKYGYHFRDGLVF
ncbi:hypothetical protein [Paenibacillus sp. 7516]|uniref:hypothetical protein n=1 Tax=Paenibacillus sp. 7516 TaxID=2022549 RepID=UPI000BA54865|nr:hypothetical protein [Paenibacillus sp. 7516]PAF30576.1 hypothetical protein CHI14_17725 [Paenibacillus sp. 7516]